MPREVSLRNAHPRLHVPRAAVARVIALLDEKFRIVPADLPHLVLPPDRKPTLRSTLARPPVPAPLLPPGELSLVFLTDAAQARLHGDFMDDPTPTDVITFEGDPASGLAGEICVSADTAAAYVKLPRARPDRQSAFAAELTLYLVHGWLHLAGYDDLRPAQKRRMRAAETRAMRLLQAASAVPAFRLR